MEHRRADSPEGGASFRDAASARAAGAALIPAGLLVAVALTLHPLPAGGFEESPSQLAGTPLWAAVHAAIAAGFVLGTVGAVLALVSGGPIDHWTSRLAWAALTIGLLWFTGVALLNGWVMHPLAEAIATNPDPSSAEQALYTSFNRLLIGFGWLGDPLFLAGLTGIAAIEVRWRPLRLAPWLAWLGLGVTLLCWLRGVGGAFGVAALNAFLLANVPAFAWLSWYGWRLARAASAQGNKRGSEGSARGL
jgi:hypothetical protein